MLVPTSEGMTFALSTVYFGTQKTIRGGWIDLFMAALEVLEFTNADLSSIS